MFLQELRDVLHEHSWVIEDALEALRMFSEHGEEGLSSAFFQPEREMVYITKICECTAR